MFLLVAVLAVIHIVDVAVVPIFPSQTNSTRVFCFTDMTNDVSFSPDEKCAGNCGYYDGQNTCCKDFVFTEDTVVRCYQTDNKTVEFNAVIMPAQDEQTITDKTQSELTCLRQDDLIDLHSTEDTSLYMKHAYLKNGYAKQYDSFFNPELIKLPADETGVECNKTKYTFRSPEVKSNPMQTNFSDKELFIQNGNFGLYLYKSDKHGIKLMTNGTVVPPPLLQDLLAAISSNNNLTQIYHDCATELSSLRIVLGLFGVIFVGFVASHGGKDQIHYQSD